MAAIISFIGRSYCGSTVINLILASHPLIFGGGELHRLGRKDKPPTCRICGSECVFWTPDFVARMQADFSYAAIAERAGKSVIVDASKPTKWFEENAATREGHELIDLCLAKHPMRHVSSFVDNQYYRDNDLHGRIRAAGGDALAADIDLEELEAYALRMSRSLLSTYKRASGVFAPNPAAARVLQYEAVMRDRRQALTPVLAAAGLAYDDAMDDYENALHHGLGGNAGAYYVVKRAKEPNRQDRWLKKNADTDKISVFRHEYYAGVKTVSIDDKYLRVLPERVRARLAADDSYKALCDLLGYDEDPEA